MNKIVLLSIMNELVEEKLQGFKSEVSPARGPRGFRGPPGPALSLEDHEETIRKWVDELSLKFDNLSAEQIESLRGPKGDTGEEGKPFSFEDNKKEISDIVYDNIEKISDKLKLKFSDLTDEEIEQLKGRPGRDGQNGKSFNFEEHSENIQSIISNFVESISDKLKLKFSDLTDEEIDKLKGRPGRDGQNGKNFNFDEHREFFESLKMKFSDLSQDEISELKLRFEDLTDDDKSQLKLKFSDLNSEDIRLLKGPRGQRGRQGAQGEPGDIGPQGLKGDKGDKGLRGDQGIRGLPGATGPRGFQGVSGDRGKDAPYIINIEIEQFKDEIRFKFTFSNGEIIYTNWETLPVKSSANSYLIGGSNRVPEVEKTMLAVDASEVGGEFLVGAFEKLYDYSMAYGELTKTNLTEVLV